ncbi:NADH-ubiquinone oxidoreductase-F iron-sulfur binding region domain-containing protein [Schumannella luteola]|uniref:NADH:ubiquinone oxidoreductase subunit F (NADH-binding) n=1 Tax=Schumannella luteola TaxID=472059 RepID=A0A852YDB2_9MICO|nr:NADH-ubiquinone oxidoreductase-F iron-sulfur binding region domain-containing protein [Schumannella luteola]NYG99290.1 NADH:ubiquinone oxidoreductase subunit F (NADH-binding) [Schumannella luteola]TPX06026.1 NADH-quinone oxidoreductase subunit F [Schumannella luteola]
MTLLDRAPTSPFVAPTESGTPRVDTRHPGSPVPAPHGVRRLLAAGLADAGEHVATFGPLPDIAPDRLLAELELAGLTGRGGAGFPVHRKLRSARDAAHAGRSGRPVVVGNGSEGEPLSAKDRLLLRSAPDLVIDGLLLAARAVDAAEVRLVADVELHPALQTVLARRADADTGGARIQLVAARGEFVGGEASAVVANLEGKRPVPRDHPVRLTIAGYRRRPTLVQNVETLAHLALVARFGGAWFRSRGTADDPGTRLVTVSAPGTPLTVLEIAGGTRLGTILTAAGFGDAGLQPAGLGAGVRAVLVGGYHGSWVPGSALDAPLDRAGLAPWGAAPGAGILHVLPHGRCGLRTAAGIAGMLAAESSGQCGPCVNGLPRIAGLLDRLARRERHPGLPAEIARVGALVDGRGACHHPDGTVRLVASTLREFASDVDAHLAGACEAER